MLCYSVLFAIFIANAEDLSNGRATRLKLRDGNIIPQLGLGVWQVDPASTTRVVSDGIRAGYRLIDTAEGYNNEEGVGQAIREADVSRSELFITSKLRNGGHARDLAPKSFDGTMQKLGIDQLDLFLSSLARSNSESLRAAASSRRLTRWERPNGLSARKNISQTATR
jgi:diketogulonate reductase-like aldo/keto reductase